MAPSQADVLEAGHAPSLLSRYAHRQTHAHPAPPLSLCSRRVLVPTALLVGALLVLALTLTLDPGSTAPWARGTGCTHEVASTTGGDVSSSAGAAAKIAAAPAAAQQKDQRGAHERNDNPSQTQPSAEELVEQWLRMPGDEVCGRWRDSYTALHKSMRSGEGPKSYLTFDRQSTTGMGDYLLGMVTTFTLALALNRSFIMRDNLLTQVVDHVAIDWHPGADVPMEGGQNGSRVAVIQYMNGPHWESSVSVPEDVLEQLSTMKEEHNLRVTTDGGILARTFGNKSTLLYSTLRDLGLRMPTAFGCIVRYLIKPKKEVLQTILPALETMRRERSSVIGINLRTSDGFAWDNHDPQAVESLVDIADQSLLQCAKDIEDFSISNGQRTLWLFMSSSEALKERIKEKYKDKVVVTDVHPVHPSFQEGKEGVFSSTMADWVLFSMCDYFVITESGFSKTAAAFNLNSPRIFLHTQFWLNAQAFVNRSRCDQSQPTSLLHFTKWSGL